MINNNHFNFWRVPSASGTVCVWLHQNNSFDSVYLICPRFIFDFLNEWKFSLFSHFCTSPDFVFIILFFISEKRNRIPQFFPPVFRWSICLWVEFFSVWSVPTWKGFSISHTLYTDTRARARRQSCWSNKLSNWFELFDNFPGQREKTFRPVFLQM